MWLPLGKRAHHHSIVGVGGQEATDETHIQQDRVPSEVERIVKDFNEISLSADDFSLKGIHFVVGGKVLWQPHGTVQLEWEEERHELYIYEG